MSPIQDAFLAEYDPTGRKPKEAGAKLDAGKPKIAKGVLQYFPRALGEVARVSEFGASKYTWKGWETVADGEERYLDALSRHILAEVTEGDITKDSGLLHAAHEAWNALARLELILRRKSK